MLQESRKNGVYDCHTIQSSIFLLLSMFESFALPELCPSADITEQKQYCTKLLYTKLNYLFAPLRSYLTCYTRCCLSDGYMSVVSPGSCSAALLLLSLLVALMGRDSAGLLWHTENSAGRRCAGLSRSVYTWTSLVANSVQDGWLLTRFCLFVCFLWSESLTC